MFPNLPVAVSRHGALFAYHSVFCIGGEIKRGSSTDRVFQLKVRDTATKWNQVASLTTPRSYFGATVFRKFLLIGVGYVDGHRTDSVELYNIQSNVWRNVPTLNHARSSCSLLSSSKGVFAIGGYDGTYLSSMEFLSSFFFLGAEINDAIRWSVLTLCSDPTRAFIFLIHLSCILAFVN